MSKRVAPSDDLGVLERNFHDLIRLRVGKLLDRHQPQLPKLRRAVKEHDDREWFRVPGMYGGFAYRLEQSGGHAALIVESWSRIVDGSYQCHRITSEGAQLTEPALEPISALDWHQRAALEPPQLKVSVRELRDPLSVKGTAPTIYEAQVFNFLLANRQRLGIKTLYKFRGVLVDGAADLSNGSRMAIEVKLRMGWAKACQAGWQFEAFLRTDEGRRRDVNGGLVFFEDFSGDWGRTSFCSPLDDGWCRWYEGHCSVLSLPIHLIRLRAGAWEAHPFACRRG